MVLPIIFNLRQRRQRRAEHRGLRLLDHAAYQDKERERNERVRNWKTEETRKHTSDYKSLRESYETDKEDAFIASKPRFSQS